MNEREKELILLNKQLVKLKDAFPKLSIIEEGLTTIIRKTITEGNFDNLISMTSGEAAYENHKNHIIIFDGDTANYVSGDLPFWNLLEKNINSFDLNLKKDRLDYNLKDSAEQTIKKIFSIDLQIKDLDNRIAVQNSNNSYIILTTILKNSKNNIKTECLSKAVIDFTNICYTRKTANNEDINYINFIQKLGASVYELPVLYFFHYFFKNNFNADSLINSFDSLLIIFDELRTTEYKGSLHLYNLFKEFVNKLPEPVLDFSYLNNLSYDKDVNYVMINLLFSFFKILKINLENLNKEDKHYYKAKLFDKGNNNDFKNNYYKATAAVGAKIARQLSDKGILTTIAKLNELVDKSNKKHLPLKVNFNDIDFYFHDKILLPVVYLNKLENKKERIHNNYYIKGKLLDEKNTSQIEKINKYTLNLKVVNFWLSNINFITANREKFFSRTEEGFTIAVDYEHFEKYIKILSELYSINFYKFYKTIKLRYFGNIIFTDFVNLLYHAANIASSHTDSLGKFNKQSPEIFKKIANNINSLKYYHQLILEQLTIYRYFKYFYYPLFHDSRGRLYTKGYGLNPQSSSNYSSLLCFFNQTNLNSYLNKMDITDINEIEETKEILLSNLYASLKGNLKDKNKLIIDQNLLNLEKTVEDCMLTEKIKLGESNKFYSLLSDLIDYLKNPLYHNFRSYYGLDSSSSGTQIHAMLLRDKQLATYSHLTTPSHDIYLSYTAELKAYHEKINNLVLSFDIELCQILQNCSNFYYENNGYFDNKQNKSDIIYFEYFRLKDSIMKLTENISTEDLVTDYRHLLTSSELKIQEIQKKKVILISKLYYISFTLKDNPWLSEIIYDRKSCKSQILSWSYGGTSQGRLSQYLNYFEDVSLIKGYAFSSKNVKTYTKFVKLVEKHLVFWLHKTIPSCLNLKKFTGFLAEFLKKNNSELVINNEFFEYTIKPNITSAIRVHLGLQQDKNFTYSKVTMLLHSNKFDKKAFVQSFMANYIQSLDSYLNYIICKKFVDGGLKIATNHDTFKTEMIYSLHLKSVCLDSYKQFLNKDFYGIHFLKNTKVEIPEKAKTLLLPGSLTSNQINCDTFVKI